MKINCIGIMGLPPPASVKSRLFVAGLEAHLLRQLATPQLSVHIMSERIGDASALKICDAVTAKDIMTMLLQMLIVATCWKRRCDVSGCIPASLIRLPSCFQVKKRTFFDLSQISVNCSLIRLDADPRKARNKNASVVRLSMDSQTND